MVKMIVTVPCCIGGKPFSVDDVVEVDEYTARALIAVKRAVVCADPSGEEAPAEEEGKKGKKTKGEKA